MNWTILFSILGGGLAGAILTQLCNFYRNRLQKMLCLYIEDDIQSKLPIKVDNVMYNNLHLKKFQLKNTTNMDLEKFSVRFVFDPNANIIDYSSHTKAGDSNTSISISNNKRNECVLSVNYFNRGDKVDVSLRIGNISQNAYYITEMNCIGFKLNNKDRRKKHGKTSSRFSKALG